MDTIRRFYALRMGCEALTKVKEGKQLPWDILNSLRLKSLE